MRIFTPYNVVIVGIVLAVFFIISAVGKVTPYQSNHKDDNIITDLGSSNNKIIEKLPDFNVYKSTSEKKVAFFNYMAQFANIVNNEVKVQRNRLKMIQSEFSKSHSLSRATEAWLDELANQYQFKNWGKDNPNNWVELLARVDVVPISMVLAQSANESAWGTSRFAREGNNLFGQWCFTKGCGIVPKRRDAGGIHQVQKFPSVLDSVRSYVLNLNTNSNYKLFRQERKKLHKKSKPLSGYILASGLNKYSERKEAYVSEIRRMITLNKLENYHHVNIG